MRRFWFLPPIALAVATIAHAGEGAALMGVPAQVVADQVIVLSWANLPGDAEEAELELSLDRRHWVRISPQFDGAERSCSWRVPDVSADRAYLRLRVGDEEREEVAVLSREFRIVGSAAAVEVSRDHPGEWWRRLALDDPSGPASVGVDLPGLTRAVGHPQAECRWSPSLRAPESGGRVPVESRNPITVPDDSPPTTSAPPSSRSGTEVTSRGPSSCGRAGLSAGSRRS